MSSSASLEASATPPTLKMSSRQLLNVSSLSKHSATGGGTPLLVADAARRRLQLAAASASRLAVHQLLGSLALLCLLSLLMAFLALFFLQRVASAGGGQGQPPDEHLALYQVAVAMSTLTISLNLCCLFVCCIQFLLGVKLLRAPNGLDRSATVPCCTPSLARTHTRATQTETIHTWTHVYTSSCTRQEE